MKRNDRLIRLVIGFAAALTAVVFAAFIVKPAEVKAEGHADHCICGGNSEGATGGQNGHTCETVTWQEVTTTAGMTSAINGVSIGGDVFIYLGSDVTMTELGQYYGRNIHLCLNGHTLKSANNNRVFYLAESTSTTPATPLLMTICDCSSDESGKIVPYSDTSVKAGQGGLIYLQKNATLELYGGSIEGGKTSGKNPGGNISIRNNSVFTMFGGRVANGTAGDAGGNIEIQMGGSMTMYGGTVEGGNSTTFAGNISVGIASSTNGKGTLTLKGGEIKDGTATTYAGNIYVSSYAAITMEGGKIRNGKANGGSSGAIYLGGSLTMSDGTIQDGTATADGGLMKIDGGSAKFTMTGGTLQGGVAGSGKVGSMLYVSGTAKVAISGDAKIIGTDSSRYDIYTLSNDFNISGTPQLYVTPSSSTMRLIQVTGTDAKLTVDGGTFRGNIYTTKGASTTINDCIFLRDVYAETSSGSVGTVTVNGGYFASPSVKPTTDNPGKVIINGGYFAAAPSLEDANLSFGTDVWKNGDDPSIPFVYHKAYVLGKESSSFTTNYVISTCKQLCGRNMILNDNLAIGIYTNVDLSEPLYKNGDETAKVSVTVNGETKEGSLSDLAERTAGGLTVREFIYDGVTPKQLGDEITVSLIASDGTSVIDTKTYSIKEYLEAIPASDEYAAYSSAQQAAMDTLIQDLLVYGREAQKKFNYKTDALVVDDSFSGSGREPSGNIADIWNKTTVTAANYQDASVVPGFFKEATVIHENTNWIRVKYTDNANDGGTTFTAEKDGGTETAVTLNGGYLCTEGLLATEYGTKLIFRAYRGTELISKTEYSLNSYCVRKHGDTGHEFSDALYNYGASAAAFAAAN